MSTEIFELYFESVRIRLKTTNYKAYKFGTSSIWLINYALVPIYTNLILLINRE